MTITATPKPITLPNLLSTRNGTVVVWMTLPSTGIVVKSSDAGMPVALYSTSFNMTEFQLWQGEVLFTS